MMSKIFFISFINNMKISNLNNSPAFGAYHIADTKNFINCIKTDIKIYKITQCDLLFLNSLKKNINLKTMMPKVDKNELEVWRELLNIGLQQAGEKCKNGLLAVFENKPCGIMAYTQKPKSFKINSISSIPVAQNHKVPLCGKTLFNILFRDFLESNAAYIDLDAVTNGPFNAVSKYMQLGFKQCGGENGIIAMRITREKVIETLNKLNQNIKVKIYKPLNETDLFKELSV